MEALPRTLQEAIVYFADAQNCNRFLAKLRWADGKVRCPYCGSDNVTYLASVHRYKCYGKHPKAQFSLKVGTIMEDSALGLDKWLAAMWLIVNCKNGISSCEIARDLGVTEKSAWHMAHRIRQALQRSSFDKLCGEIEVDETFIGGKARNMHVGKGERRITGTVARTKWLSSESSNEMARFGPPLFQIAAKKRFRLKFASAWKPDQRSTDALLSNNRRDMDDFDRFKFAASQIVGKRLTWNELTGKVTTPTSVNWERARAAGQRQEAKSTAHSERVRAMR